MIKLIRIEDEEANEGKECQGVGKRIEDDKERSSQMAKKNEMDDGAGDRKQVTRDETKVRVDDQPTTKADSAEMEENLTAKRNQGSVTPVDMEIEEITWLKENVDPNANLAKGQAPQQEERPRKTTTVAATQTMRRLLHIEQEENRGPKIVDITYITSPRVLVSQSQAGASPVSELRGENATDGVAADHMAFRLDSWPIVASP